MTPPPPVVVVTPPAPAPVVVIQSVDDFYAPLAADGRWVAVASYGRVWVPAHVDPGWRPYANGYWQRTDAGWYWMSDEPWGWATYHYGRWDWHAQNGWIWVPQTQWAPAWVCWREGGGYVGWAPLRPSVSVGVSFTVAEYEPAFATRAFVFVEQRRMLEPVRPKTIVVNSPTVINKTVNITSVKVVNRNVINEGPRPDLIERASGRKVQAIPAHEFRRREETAVAARQTEFAGVERKTPPPPAGTRVAPKAPVNPRSVMVVEKPTTSPAPAAPVRPTSPTTVVRVPARSESKTGPETPENPVKTAPTVSPKAKAEVKPAPTAATRGTLRPVETPAKPTPVKVQEPVSAPSRPTPTTVTRELARSKSKTKPETPVNPVKTAPTAATRGTLRRVETPAKPTPTKVPQPVSPPAVERKPGSEIRADTRPPVRVEPLRPTSAKIEALRPAPDNKRLMSPKEKSQSDEQSGTNRKNSKRQGTQPEKKSQPTPTPRAATPPGR